MIAFTTHDGYVVADGNEISYVQANGSHSLLYLRDGGVIEVMRSISKIAMAVPADTFLRIHHSYLVNKRMIRHFHKTGQYVEMRSGVKLPVASRRKMEFREAFVTC